jgi:hypothetical protein
MPDRYDLKNILDKGFEVANKVQFDNGQDPLDEVSFVYGFINCFGIITGRVDIGLDQNVPLDKVLDAIHEDIVAFGRRVADNQAKQNKLRGKLNG